MHFIAKVIYYYFSIEFNYEKTVLLNIFDDLNHWCQKLKLPLSATVS